jgi:putative sterol carrier protein
MRSVLDQGSAGGRPCTYEFRIDGEAFHLRVGAGEEGERIEAGQGPDPDLVIVGDAETFLAVASGRLGPKEALESGVIRVEGECDEGQEALLAWYRHAIGPPAA